MTRERLDVGRALFISLPPCGGGLGRGVATPNDLRCIIPLPPMLRIVDLPRKGGGNKSECRS
jgi:hypothetical protein